MTNKGLFMVNDSVSYREVKCCTFTGFGFSPYPAAMSFQNSSDSSQSHPGSLKLLVGVEPLERIEQLFGFGAVKPGAVITYIKYLFGGSLHLAKRNYRIGDFPGVFPGISKKVIEYYAHQRTVGGYLHAILNIQGYNP